MRVKLGDGREVECDHDIVRCPPGPMPTHLASEVSRPHGSRLVRHDGQLRDPNEAPLPRRPRPSDAADHGEGVRGDIPPMLRASFTEESDERRAKRRGGRRGRAAR